MKAIIKLSGGLLMAGAAIALIIITIATQTPTLMAGTFSNSSLTGTFSFRLVPAESFAPFFNADTCPSAPNSGVCSAPRQDILRVGVISFNGAGGVTGRALATTDDGQTTVVIDFTFSGTYALNTDGTGTMTIGPGSPNPNEGTETYSIVINEPGTTAKAVELAETDNVGGGAKIFLTGTATRSK